MMPTDDSVMRSIVLPVPPEEAWDALTRPSELAEWLADEVVCDDDLDEGSSALLRWDDGQSRVAVVDEADEPRRLTFRWSSEGVSEEETRVEFTLVELPRRETLLTVVESGWAPLPADWGPKLVAHTGALARA
jgi:uncharacterized protein YndB with AHSA1/START domain